MFKKLIAAGAVSMLFACSSSDDGPDDPAPGGQSSSSGDGSSSSSEVVIPEPQVIYDLLQNFNDDLPENVVGYAFGTATIANDSIPALDDDGEPILDENDNPVMYVFWNPEGILTLKDFSFNGGSTTSGENGGGLMVKEIEVKNYSAFRFKVRGTVPDFNFRIKVEVPNPDDPDGEPLSAAWQKRVLISEEFQTLEVELAGTSKVYDQTGLGLDRAAAIELATIVEFSLRSDGTLEIDDFEGGVLEVLE